MLHQAKAELGCNVAKSVSSSSGKKKKVAGPSDAKSIKSIRGTLFQESFWASLGIPWASPRPPFYRHDVDHPAPHRLDAACFRCEVMWSTPA